MTMMKEEEHNLRRKECVAFGKLYLISSSKNPLMIHILRRGNWISEMLNNLSKGM